MFEQNPKITIKSETMDESMNTFDLPNGYNYALSENGAIRIKEVNDIDTAQEWLEKLKECSKITWRSARTYKPNGRRNLYKRDFRCQHKIRIRKPMNIKISKNTDCPATLQIAIRQTTSKTKWMDSAAPDWPCAVTFRGVHNHELDTPEVLKYRDMSEDTRERLLTLFYLGHSPSSALHYLKTDLFLKYGDKYNEMSQDGYYVPTISKIDKLYNKEFPDKASRPAVKMKHSSNDEQIYPSNNSPAIVKAEEPSSDNYSEVSAENFSEASATENYSEVSATENYSEVSVIENYSEVSATENCSQLSPTQNYSSNTELELSNTENYSRKRPASDFTAPQITEEEMQAFEEFYIKVKEGLKSKPEVYGPPFKRMVQKITDFSYTEAGLVSTIRQFGNSGFRGRPGLSKKVPQCTTLTNISE